MTGLLYSASHGMWNDRTNLLHKSLQMILPDYFSPPDLTGDMTAQLYSASHDKVHGRTNLLHKSLQMI